MNNTINLNSWNEVEEYIDNSFLRIPPSYFERAVMDSRYPRDAFSKGQLASKSWLLGELYKITPLPSNMTVAILGCWIGSLVEPLLNALTIERIYGLDIDAKSIEMAEKFNQKHVANGWKFKGVVADVSILDCNHMEFETGGELIKISPDCIINTSCEHMNTEWFKSAGSDQLIVMQTNNSPDFEGHINPVASLNEMEALYPLRKSMYSGQLVTPSYTRFMQIGWK
jgi:hypothetical protein|tara:strand:+ start:596 stop:1273 length:678 start_codon:yes stop_codon:yes gene_type:complete